MGYGVVLIGETGREIPTTMHENKDLPTLNSYVNILVSETPLGKQILESVTVGKLVNFAPQLQCF